MKINWGIYIIALCFFSLKQSKATTIIVAPAGGAFITIQAGVNAANAGDTVLVKAGTYNEAVSFPRSGSLAGGYITLLLERPLALAYQAVRAIWKSETIKFITSKIQMIMRMALLSMAPVPHQ